MGAGHPSACPVKMLQSGSELCHTPWEPGRTRMNINHTQSGRRLWHVAAALQKMAAVETASAEERERLRATYKQRMQDMDARLKVVSDVGC